MRIPTAAADVLPCPCSPREAAPTHQALLQEEAEATVAHAAEDLHLISGAASSVCRKRGTFISKQQYRNQKRYDRINNETK